MLTTAESCNLLQIKINQSEIAKAKKIIKWKSGREEMKYNKKDESSLTNADDEILFRLLWRTKTDENHRLFLYKEYWDSL